jgi:hypothetical protein
MERDLLAIPDFSRETDGLDAARDFERPARLAARHGLFNCGENRAVTETDETLIEVVRKSRPDKK